MENKATDADQKASDAYALKEVAPIESEKDRAMWKGPLVLAHLAGILYERNKSPSPEETKKQIEELEASNNELECSISCYKNEVAMDAKIEKRLQSQLAALVGSLECLVESSQICIEGHHGAFLPGQLKDFYNALADSKKILAETKGSGIDP